MALGVVLLEKVTLLQSARTSNCPHNPFATMGGFRVNHKLKRNIRVTEARSNSKHTVRVTYERDEKEFLVELENGQSFHVSGSISETEKGLQLQYASDVKRNTCEIFKHGWHLYCFSKEDVYKFILEDEKCADEFVLDELTSAEVVSPMPGTVDKVLIKSGDPVKSGDPLITVIAMKMEHIIKSPKDGIIKDVNFKPGDYVEKDVALLTWQ